MKRFPVPALGSASRRNAASPEDAGPSGAGSAPGALRRFAAAALLGLPLAFGLADAALAKEGIVITAPPDAPEGHSGLTNQTFEVRLTGPVSGDVNYKVCFSGTATYADDYNPTLDGTQQSSNCVNGRIGRGRTTPDSAIGIAVVGDEISESGRWRGEYGETVTAHLTLVGAQPWDLDGRRAHTVTHTILNDDVAVSFRQADYEGREGKRLRIQVDLVESTQGYPWNVTVPFTYTRGTASSGDYDASRTSLTFRRGEITQDLYVDLTDDSSFDSGETFTIDLDTASFPTGMYDSGIARARVTIKDNDYSISASSSSHAAREDAGGVSIPVTISPAQERTVGVRVGFSDINASGGQDYLRKHHSFPDDILTFHPGETAKWIFVPVVNDGAFEQNELFKVTLTQTVGATDPETVDIIIKDHRPGNGEYTSKLILERTSRDTVSEGQSATFRLTMHPAVQEGSTVAVLLSQSADDGVRANWIAGAPETHAHYKTVSFARGESVKTLTVPIRSDRRDTNGTLTVAAMAPGDHPASAGPFTARGQKVTAKVRIQDTIADGDPHASAQETAAIQVPTTAVSNLQVTAVDGNTAKATWDAVPHATGYRVEFESTSALAYQGNYIQRGSNGHTGTSWTFDHDAAEPMTLTVTVTPEVRQDGSVQQFHALAGTATIEVGPSGTQSAGTQDTAAASACHDDVKPAVRGYAKETHHGTAHVTRWKQVLAAFGDDNGHAAMSLATAKQMRDKYSANRWDPVVDALQCIEDAADETPAPADPVVSVTGGGGVTEGGDAVFTVAASPAPAADLDVTVAVSDDATADFLAAGDEGTRTVTILAGQASATLTLPTVNDTTDEPDGSVGAALQPGTGYAVADAPANAAKVLVSDDDDPAPADPVVSVSGGNAVTEGGDAVFTVAASPAPAASLDVTLAVSDDATADFLAAGDEGSRTVTILAGQASATLTLPTVNDGTDEPDGSVSAALQPGAGYAVADPPADAAKVAVSDDDAAASGPTLSVNDVTVKEGPYRQVWFTVTLSEATRLGASFSWRVRESSPVSAKRNLDFGAPSGKSYAYIRPGATRLRIKAAHVVDDSHDEGSETFEIVLSDANGATIADGVGVATIVNSDPMPRDHLGHAGHSLASGVAASVAERANAARPSLGVTPGLDGTSAEVGTEGGWAVWTRATGASFGADGLSGDSRRVTFGADLDRGDGLLLGVMAVTDAAESASRGYMAETDTLAVVPWAAMNGTWAALGAGTGEMSLAHGPETMEAGSEWVFAGAGWTDGSVSGDAFWQRMSSDAAEGLAPAAGETWRLRLGWAGAFAPTPSLTLSPSLSLFGEGGDIPGESGLEAGLGLSWTQGPWSLDAHALRAFTGGDGDAHALSGTLTRSWRNTRMFVSEDTVGAEFRKEF